MTRNKKTENFYRRRLFVRLDELQHKAEWPLAKRPTDAAFKDARAFVENLPLGMIPLPTIGVADDGEVNFLWTSQRTYVDLGFYGDGTFSFFGQREGEAPIFGDNLPADGGVPRPFFCLFGEAVT